jgi:cyclophilin family peptidyl-prolyl cis-trans isomerase
MSQDKIIMELKTGPVVIALRSDLAPNHVARIKELSGRGFYDGVAFHRVIPGFMAQTGDPTGTGSGGSELPDLKAEFSSEKHTRGTVSMARTSSPNSANSQFFICFEDAPWLDRQYTVWGQVVDGMEHIDAVKKGGEHNNGTISGEPDRIVTMRVGDA